MEWPLRNEKTGKPSTTPTNQQIWEAAIQPARAERPQEVEAWQSRLESSAKNWRQRYVDVVREFCRIQASCSPQVAVEMCRAGLEAANEKFVFVHQDLERVSIRRAFEEQQEDDTAPVLTSITYTGGSSLSEHKPQDNEEGNIKPFALASPHGSDDDPLWVAGNDAVAQLDTWERYGCMEPSAAEHARAIVEADDPSVYCRDKVFVLLGVTSAMGPAQHLLKLPGAHVLGVARTGHKMESLVEWFRRKQGSPFAKLTLIQGGADMLKQGPQIARWIVETLQKPETGAKSKRVVLMPLAYMDGEANCRVTVAMDAILSYVMRRLENSVELAYLTSPTTCYTIPKEAAEDAKQRYEQSKGDILRSLVSLASFGTWLQPSNTWEQNSNHPILFNGIVPLQGPNYVLAKTMQQWRGIVAHDGGTIVAAPHAPGTRTYSVVHNANAAAGLEGLQFIEPLLTFDVLPCSSLMTCIVLHQLYQKQQNSSSPKEQEEHHRHPMDLFWDGSVHGGSWRCPYDPASCLVAGFLLGKTIAKQGWCPTGALAPAPMSQ